MTQSCKNYSFKVSDYYLTFKNHHNGILVLISKENYDYTAKFGLTKYNSFTLHDFDWYDLKEEEEDQFPTNASNTEKAAYILFYNIDGGSIGDQKDQLHLSNPMIKFLVAVILDMLLGQDITWLSVVNDNNNNNDEQDLYQLVSPDQILYAGKTYLLAEDVRQTFLNHN